ncbi:MAG: hypothetical protein ACLQG3_18025 [Terracidiphilus sp.]
MGGIDQRQQRQQQREARRDAARWERVLCLIWFMSFRLDRCSGKKKAASANAESRRVVALVPASLAQAHDSRVAQQHARTAAGLSRNIMR